MGDKGGGLFLASLAPCAPCRAIVGSWSPAVGEQVLGSAQRSGIWRPGSGHFLSQADIDQLKRIMEVVGTPSSEVLAKISSEHVSPLEAGRWGDAPDTMWGAWATVAWSLRRGA